MKDEKVYKNYLKDLGELVKEMSEEAKKEYKKDGTEFHNGYLMACYGMVSLMKDQAKAFGIDEKDIGMKGFEAENLIDAGKNTPGLS